MTAIEFHCKVKPKSRASTDCMRTESTLVWEAASARGELHQLYNKTVKAPTVGVAQLVEYLPSM